MSILEKLFTRRNYMAFVSLIGFAIILLNFPDFSLLLRTDIFLFLLLSIIASNTSIQFKSGMNMTLTSPVITFLLLIIDIRTTVLLSCLGLLTFQIRSKRSLDRVIFNLAQLTISTYLTGGFLNLFDHTAMRLPRDFLFIVPAILIFEFVNLMLVSIAVSLTSKEPLSRVFIDGLAEGQIGMPLYLANGLIMYICYQAYSFWGLTLVIIPLLSVNWLLKAAKSADEHKENSMICPTTHLKNKRCLNEWLDKEYPSVIRNDQNISFILIDIDDFKKVNDQHGHDVGDQVLTDFGTLIKENIRVTDLIYRYGGEEFVIILPGFDESQANVVIERLRSLVNEHIFTVGDLKITFSAGIAALDSSLLHDVKLNSADEMIRRADMAMYTAKQSGKNQTKFFKH